jgi:hypothetical protein
MAMQAGLAVFDGAHVWMFAGFARLRAALAVRRGEHELVIEQMLFDAGGSLRSGDLFAGFWRDEAVEMDWLEDFLCDPATDEMMTVLKAPPIEESYENEEMLFTKTQLVTTGMGMADYS